MTRQIILRTERLASEGPLKNRTILNQSVKTFEIGMALGFPSSVFEPPVYNHFGLSESLNAKKAFVLKTIFQISFFWNLRYIKNVKCPSKKF